jgi:hypothetical protein
VTRSASHPILCLRPITGHGCARLAREFGSASDLEDCIGRDLLPTRCAHVICPHRRGEVVERSPAGTNVRLGVIRTSPSTWLFSDLLVRRSFALHRHGAPDHGLRGDRLIGGLRREFANQAVCISSDIVGRLNHQLLRQKQTCFGHCGISSFDR